MPLLDRLPRGTAAIGGGLVVNGLTAYAFITIAARDLGAEAYSPVGLLWAMSFLLGPGFFQPLEQETARIIASRARAGVGPVVRSAAVVGGLVALPLALLATVSGPWLVDDFFDGEVWLLVGLLLVVTGLGMAHLVKGVLAGLGRFNGYARYVMGEGVGRLVVLLLVLVVLSRGLSGPLSGVGAYGLAIGLAPFVGIGVALVGQRGLFVPGPPAHLGDLSRAFGALLVASVATALVLNVSPLAVEVLADVGQEDEPGRFLNALLVARIPLFFFQAVQASLLPQLSGLAGSGRYGELWATLRRLLALVASIGAVAVAGAAVLGPWVVEMAFGGEFAVGRRDMVLLTTSSGVLMLVLALAQALIACRSQARVALAWVVGVAAFPVAVALFDDLFLRVEMGLIATVSVTALIMSVMLVRRLRHESAGPAG
ncbi:MAG: hypothetical protein MK184_09365 [Acidimicrobiales bacterium]|nr:hypothetical protein [Acidimicrobiales bacterium]